MSSMLRPSYIFLSIAKSQISVAIANLGLAVIFGEDCMCETMHLSQIRYNIIKFSLW
jgi:hypothetical protein